MKKNILNKLKSSIKRHSVLTLLAFLMSVPVFSQNISGVINDYASVSGISGTTFTVDDATNFSVGQQVLIIQMQGAIISESDNASYGDLIDSNGAGDFELATITGISGNSITFDSVSNVYDANGSVQIVSVPDYSSNALTTVSGTLTSDAWDGTKGGIVVLKADELQLDANINVSGLGFRGGTIPQTDGVITGYVSTAGAQKGEGIAKFGAVGDRKKGKQANGGGGGNWVNSGGGGGGNYGKGGNGGNNTANRGGVGGLATSCETTYGVLLGGGGGAGDVNDGNITSGGNGGGIVMIFANTVTGNGGNIISNGNNGLGAGVGDGTGGGGAGGTLYAEVTTWSGNLTVQLNGGRSQTPLAGHGIGGGGGGGAFFVLDSQPSTSVVTFQANGGTTGTGSGNIGLEPGGAGGVTLITDNRPPRILGGQTFSLDTSKPNGTVVTGVSDPGNGIVDAVDYAGNGLTNWTFVSSERNIHNYLSISSSGEISVSNQAGIASLPSGEYDIVLTVDNAVGGETSCPKIIKLIIDGDADGDGILDIIDIDDDNDGIPDSMEIVCSSEFLATATSEGNGLNPFYIGTISNGSNTADFSFTMDATTSASWWAAYDDTSGWHYSWYSGTASQLTVNENYKLTSTSSGLGNFKYGVNVPKNNTGIGTQVNNEQSITFTWSTGEKAIISNPSGQITSHVDGEEVSSPVTITISSQTINNSDWSIEIQTELSKSFELDVSRTIASGTFTWESFGFNIGLCDNPDLDNDGKYNHLDTDSDGDGCFDAIEAGVGEVVDTNGRIATTGAEVGTNGLDNDIETDDTLGASTTYNSTYYDYALSNNLNLCTDTDGDGIGDLIDIDDDNDGILDIVESPNCYYTEAEAKVITSVTSDLTIEAATRPFTNAYDGDDSITSYTGLSLNQNGVGLSVYEIVPTLPVAISSIDFSMYNYAFTSGAANTVKLQGYANGVWEDLNAAANHTVINGIDTFTNTLHPTTVYEKFRITGGSGVVYYARVKEIYINVANYNIHDNPKTSCSDDADSDGKYNHLDLDSDGDGCPDAKESSVTSATGSVTLIRGDVVNGDGTNNTTVSTSNAVVQGDYGTNGFADSLETSEDGIFTGTYTYANALNALVSNCVCSVASVTTGTPEITKTGISTLDIKPTNNWPLDVNNGFLVLESTNKGLVITRIADPETAIANPIEGMLVFDTTEKCLKLYKGVANGGWSCIQRACL